MSVWEQYTELFARNWRCGRYAQSLSQGCSEKIRKKDIVMTAGRWSSWSIQIPQFLMLWWPARKAGSAAVTQRPRDRVSSGSMLPLPDPRRPDRANPPTNFWWSLFFFFLFFFFFFDSTGMIYMHWVPTGQTVNKGYYVEVLKEFRKRFLGKRPALFKSGQWHFLQDNAPILNSILVTDYLTKMGIKTVPHPPYNPDLAPCDFCSRTRLLRRGLEFHVCTINKSAQTKKVWKLI